MTDEHDDVEARRLEALAMRHGTVVPARLAALLGDDDWRVRKQAAETASACATRASRPSHAPLAPMQRAWPTCSAWRSCVDRGRLGSSSPQRSWVEAKARSSPSRSSCATTT
jgi:hypothetical protein